MLTIRLRRMGFRHQPTYRVVAIDSRRARDGKYLESLGHYNPRKQVLQLDIERIRYWLARGAQPSESAARLIRRYEKLTASPQTTGPEPETSMDTKPQE